MGVAEFIAVMIRDTQRRKNPHRKGVHVCVCVWGGGGYVMLGGRGEAPCVQMELNCRGSVHLKRTLKVNPYHCPFCTYVGEQRQGNVSNTVEATNHPRGMMEALACGDKQHACTPIIPRAETADVSKTRQRRTHPCPFEAFHLGGCFCLQRCDIIYSGNR
jgi:hypothetical protein